MRASVSRPCIRKISRQYAANSSRCPVVAKYCNWRIIPDKEFVFERSDTVVASIQTDEASSTNKTSEKIDSKFIVPFDRTAVNRDLACPSHLLAPWIRPTGSQEYHPGIRKQSVTQRLRKELTAPMSMKAVRIHDYGDPTVLRYENMPVPQPRADEVLLRVRA